MHGFFVQAEVVLVNKRGPKEIGDQARLDLLAGKAAHMILVLEGEHPLEARRRALHFASKNGVRIRQFVRIVPSIGKSGRAYVFVLDGELRFGEPKKLPQETYHESLD